MPRTAAKGWATAYQTEARQPQGVQGGGRFTAGSINPAARQREAVARNQAQIAAHNAAAGGSPGGGEQGAHASAAARAQASEDLREAAQLATQIRALNAEVKNLSRQYKTLTGYSPPGSSSGNAKPSNAAAVSQQAKPGSAAGSSAAGKVLSQIGALRSRIAQLRAQRAQLLKDAAALLHGARKTSLPVNTKGNRVAVLAPEASKAATLDGPDVVHAPLADIAKWEEGPDGRLYVYGKATTPEVDTDEQIVDPDFSAKALQDWLDTAPALRVQHNASRDPAGSGVRLEVNRDGDGAHWVKGVVDEPVAARLVKNGHLRAFSVGIAAPTIVRDATGKARGGVIKAGRIVEVSLVDSPANRSCFLEIAKAAGDGSAEFTGKVFGAGGLLTKEAKPKTVTVELPKDLSVSIKPSQLAKLATFGQRLAREQAAAKAAAASVAKAATAGAAKRDFDRNVGGGVDRDKIPSSDFAGRNRSFPIVTQADVSDAFQSIGRAGEGNYPPEKLRRNIRRIARRKGFTLPASEQKPKAKATKSAAAKPQVTKCACGDTGMVDGQPCTECKPGRRMAKRLAKKAAKAARASVHAALAPGVAKKKGKLRAICPGCGAKQNPEHMHCPECGGKLPARPVMVSKNHDFVCLGCGKDLDKGERFCPGCGKENPGHNPMADQKIPVNEATKAGKGRVAKGKKKRGKKGKGEPFGGQQAPPFGARDEDGAKTEKGMKPGKGKKPKAGRKPTPAQAGGVPGQHDRPAPPHREPDGAEIENFERDAHLEDGDSEKPTKLEAPTLKGDPETAASLALKAVGVPQHLGALHALTCPAYKPKSVSAAFPHASFAAIDPAEWMAGSLEKAASAPLDEAQTALELYHAAVTLRGSDPYALADLRAAAHKAFRDANPGPSSFPEPGQISPARFSRPYLEAGHAAPSPGQGAPHHARLPEVGGVNAQDYTRGYLHEGHAAESPQSQHTPGPMQPPAHAGEPTSEPARGFLSSNAIESMRHAMSVMHDHISRRFPDVCPMEASLHIGSQPVPVPHGVPQPGKAPGASKAAKRKARKAAKVKARKAARKMAARRRKLERKVFTGKMSINQARAKLGLQPWDPPGGGAAAKAALPGTGPGAPAVAAALDPDALAAAIAQANAPILAQLKRADRAAKAANKAARTQAKKVRKLQKTADAIASQPDTSQSPMRMAALSKNTSASAAAVLPQSVLGAAEQAQATKMRLLHDEWRNSPSPERREAAYAEYTKMLGIQTQQPTTDMTPMRT